MDKESYELQVKWVKGKEAKIKKLKEEVDKTPSFKPHMYTATKQKKLDGHAAEMTAKASADYAGRQQRAREVKKQQQDKFDKLGNVNHSKQRSLDVVLPVEATKGSDSRQPLSDEEDAWKGNMGSPGARGYVLDEEDINQFEEETLVEMLQRERREWHNERTKLIHCVHIQQMELMQRASAAHERAAEIAKEFARTIEGFEERLYNVEANVQKEIIAIKILAENLKAGAAGSSTAVEGRLTHLEKGIDTIIDKLNSTQIGSARNNNNAR